MIGILSLPICEQRMQRNFNGYTYESAIFTNTWHRLWKRKLGDIDGAYGFNGVPSYIRAGVIVRLKCVYHIGKKECTIYVKHENNMLKRQKKNGWNLWLQGIKPPIVSAVSLTQTDHCVDIIL